MNAEEHYRSILAKQLAMNEQTWAALQNHGVTEQTMLRLEFLYWCSSESQARRLMAFLRKETDYNVAMEADDETAGQWIVTGQTQEAAVSKEILDQLIGFQPRITRMRRILADQIVGPDPR